MQNIYIIYLYIYIYIYIFIYIYNIVGTYLICVSLGKEPVIAQLWSFSHYTGYYPSHITQNLTQFVWYWPLVGGLPGVIRNIPDDYHVDFLHQQTWLPYITSAFDKGCKSHNSFIFLKSHNCFLVLFSIPFPTQHVLSTVLPWHFSRRHGEVNSFFWE